MGIRFRLGAGLLLVVSLLTASIIASAQDDPPPYNIHGFEFHAPEFYNVWERTDRPVQEGVAVRSWLWGPAANTPLIEEPYLEAEDGVRLVQYGDKSRMEMPVSESNAAADDADSPWNITQGLLARELMTGQLQIGDDLFEDHAPSNHPAAGDPDGVTAPTYATMGLLMNADARVEGQVITQFVHRSGDLEDIPALEIYGVTDEYFISETGYYIADVFWDFMNSTGPVYENGTVQVGDIFESPFYAVGFPLTPAVWSWTKVDNVKQNVLIQCFERRCLTYTPDNEPDWRVETGNIGQHYFHWRYHEIAQPPVDDDDTDDAVDDSVDDGVDDTDDGVDDADDGVDDADDGVDDSDDSDPPAVEPESFTVTPATSTNLIGTSHEITVTVEGSDDEPFTGASVSAEVTDGPHDGTDLEPATAITDNNGIATLSYTGTDVGTDTIEVTVVGIDTPETVNKAWVEYALTLAQEEAINIVGTEHEFTATLTDVSSDDPVNFDTDDVTTTIARDGGTFVPGDLTIDSINDGVATMTYTGPTNPGTDTINVSVEVLGATVVGAPELTKEWVTEESIIHFTEDLVAIDEGGMGCERECPSGGQESTSAFGRDNVLQISIHEDEAHSTSNYHRTEGLKLPWGPRDNFEFGGNFGHAVEIDLYLDPAWGDTAVRAGLWVVGPDGDDDIDGIFGILEFANVAPSSEGDPELTDGPYEGWRTWESTGDDAGWTNHDEVSFTYGEWVTLRIEHDPDEEEFTYFVDGIELGTATAGDQFIRNIVFNSFNFGEHEIEGLEVEDYDVHWHRLVTNLPVD